MELKFGKLKIVLLPSLDLLIEPYGIEIDAWAYIGRYAEPFNRTLWN